MAHTLLSQSIGRLGANCPQLAQMSRFLQAREVSENPWRNVENLFAEHGEETIARLCRRSRQDVAKWREKSAIPKSHWGRLTHIFGLEPLDMERLHLNSRRLLAKTLPRARTP